MIIRILLLLQSQQRKRIARWVKNGNIANIRFHGRVARQSSAKARTAVRIRLKPLKGSLEAAVFFYLFQNRFYGRVARQSSAKARTAVRIRLEPQKRTAGSSGLFLCRVVKPFKEPGNPLPFSFSPLLQFLLHPSAPDNLFLIIFVALSK